MLDRKQHYLQIALNGTLSDAKNIINQIPLDKRIIIEAGTPLIKTYGIDGIKAIRDYWEERISKFSSTGSSNSKSRTFLLDWRKNDFPLRKSTSIKIEPFIVADLKCMDRGTREVEIARQGGANAVTALGEAPIETLDAFIQKCEEYGLDSMIDMMNVNFPLAVLRKLKKLPRVVMLHRGVDEEAFNREKQIPFHEIQRIKSNYDIMVSVAGGDTFRDVQEAIFNDANIVVVWKSFYKNTAETAKLAKEFLKEIR